MSMLGHVLFTVLQKIQILILCKNDGRNFESAIIF